MKLFTTIDTVTSRVKLLNHLVGTVADKLLPVKTARAACSGAFCGTYTKKAKVWCEGHTRYTIYRTCNYYYVPFQPGCPCAELCRDQINAEPMAC